jgi:hypothetical protein
LTPKKLKNPKIWGQNVHDLPFLPVKCARNPPFWSPNFFETALLQIETYEKNKTRIEKKHEILSQYQTLSPIYDF